MASLVWDDTGNKNYETGIDRGVLYDSTGKAIAWNGLTSVAEGFDELEVEERYYEGCKQYDLAVEGSFIGTLSAFTYPDEFMEHEGAYEVETGMFTGEQEPITFGLSFRTWVGDGSHYKIHVLYGLTAIPSSKSYETIGATVSPIEFDWDLFGLPQLSPGYRPSSHVIIDSAKSNPTMLSILEATFYGNPNGSNGRLMPMWELIRYVKDNWS